MTKSDLLSDRARLLIRLALEEDVGSGDLTTAALIEPEREAECIVLAKEPLVVFGQQLVPAVFQQLDPNARYRPFVSDGVAADAGASIGRVSGRLAALLTGERTALNFLQHLSGIATLTRKFVERATGHKLLILDTRKTTPAFRELEKQAVHAGGGTNHRHGLYDAVLIKNNHIDAFGGTVQAAVERARARSPKGTRIQVEVRNEAELRAALEAKPDALLLDNLQGEELRRLVRLVRESFTSAVFLEASGGVSLETLDRYFIEGLNAVSVGALTHSARAVDISFRFANGGR